MGIDLEGLNPGIFSRKDCRVLFDMVQSCNINTVLEIGGRTGRTTSVMVQANPDIVIHTFEVDEVYHDILRKISPNVKVHGNVIGPELQIDQYDMIFIDGQHDYIFAKWYVENILDRCTNQLIHIHDMPYNGSLESLDIINSNIVHPDIISADKLKDIYGNSMYNKYKIDNFPIAELWEGDIVAKFIQDNDVKFFCTYDGNADNAVKDKSPQIQNCSLYMERSNVGRI
jgi:hypothetical protein